MPISVVREESGDPEPTTEKEKQTEIKTEETGIPSHHGDPALQAMTVDHNGEDDVEATPKKSLAFKLAFIGLAAIGFVFQMDATALGIALPVS
jgi:hypothetical protein